MSLSTLRTQVKRLAQELIPPGAIVTVCCHDCQRPADCEAQARRALGRERRRADMVIVILTEDDCDPWPHQHHDELIVHHRVN